jgi:hypothetical protein
MRIPLTAFALFSVLLTGAQSLHVGGFAGISNYQGDLTDKFYGSKMIRPALGVGLEYEFSDRFSLRSSFTYGRVAGDDKKNGKELKPRNLNFATNIIELGLTGEFRLLNMSELSWTPYLMAGIAFFNFDPYTEDAAGNKVFLKPLSTEGQGLTGYPDKKPYSNTQFAIPFGGGIKYQINETIGIAFETGIRKLFTDYLDDVSTTFADEADLLAARGQKAVDLSYRADEVEGGNPVYPGKGSQRGNPKLNDWYYFSGLRVTVRLGGGYNPSSANSKRNRGCPVVD